MIDQLSNIWRDVGDPSNIRDWKPEDAPEVYPPREAISIALSRAVVADVNHGLDAQVSQRNNTMDWTDFTTRNDKLTGPPNDLQIPDGGCCK